MQAEQVPEAAPSREQQLMWLLQKLAGHRVFGSLRGRMSCMGSRSPSIEVYLMHMIWDSRVGKMVSPSQFCGQWDDLSKRIRVIGNLLCWLHHHGWRDAAAELEKALVDLAVAVVVLAIARLGDGVTGHACL